MAAPQAPEVRGSANARVRPVDEHGYEQRTHREILLVMSGLMISMLLAMLDNMIVAPALPTIVGDLGGLKHLAWVTTAYILGTTVATPLWGKLMDIFSRKAMFMAAIVIFLGGSALSGAAQTMNQLIAFRALQGIGAGGLIVGVMAVLGVLIAPRERGRYMGYFMAIMPVSMIAGPLVGGWITDNASWRWAFYVNLPIGAVALVVIASTMHLPKPSAKTVRIDLVGAALLTVWIGALTLVTSWGGTQYAWDSAAILGLLGLTLVAFVAFLRVQTRVADPIMPLGVFRNLNFALAGSISFIVGFGMFGGMTFLPQFQQYVQGASATNSGLLLLPMMIGIVLSSLTAGQISSRSGHYRSFPIIGTALMTLGLILLSTVTVHTTRTVTGVWMFVMGLGMGMLFQITMLIAQNSVALKDIGAATAATTFLRSMGGSIGVSMLGSLYAARITDSMELQLGAHSPLGGNVALAPEMVRRMPSNVVVALQNAITHGVVGVFGWAAAICAIGVVVALFVKQVPLRGSAPARNAATAAPTATAPATAPAPASAVAVASNGHPVAVAPHTLSGRVAERDGHPLAGAAVTMLDVAGGQIGGAVADESGGFVVESPIGTLPATLVVSAVGFEPHVRRVASGQPHEVVLEALPPRLFGRVHSLDEVDGRVVLSALDAQGMLLARTNSRAGGRFALGGLPDGPVSLVVQAAGFAPYVTEVTIGPGGASWLEVALVADGPPGRTPAAGRTGSRGQSPASVLASPRQASGEYEEAVATVFVLE
jgi:EmrB/QacA subfamily drug resistance transporter